MVCGGGFGVILGVEWGNVIHVFAGRYKRPAGASAKHSRTSGALTSTINLIITILLEINLFILKWFLILLIRNWCGNLSFIKNISMKKIVLLPLLLLLVFVSCKKHHTDPSNSYFMDAMVGSTSYTSFVCGATGDSVTGFINIGSSSSTNPDVGISFWNKLLEWFHRYFSINGYFYCKWKAKLGKLYNRYG